MVDTLLLILRVYYIPAGNETETTNGSSRTKPWAGHTNVSKQIRFLENAEMSTKAIILSYRLHSC